METTTFDPTTRTIDFEGRQVDLKTLADAHDVARAQRMVHDPVQVHGIEVRDSGAGEGQYTVEGHAAVFNQWSLDLGWFRERIAPGAFANVLSRRPDVHAVWEHDNRYTLGRTINKTLELREVDKGLHMWTRVAPTSYALDLRVLLERGDVDQMSFAFSIASDEWLIENDGESDEQISRTILEVKELYDVTICAQGAYPQTDVSVVRSLISQDFGRSVLPGATPTVAPSADGTTQPSRTAGGDSTRELVALQAKARSRLLSADVADLIGSV